MPQLEAAKGGYSQILWLNGDDHTLTEVRSLCCKEVALADGM
jgi:hypothetical protein